MKTRNVLNTVAHTLPDWHVGNDRQFGRITAYDPQARYEIIVNFPDRDTIRIVRMQYELVEDNTVLNTADMGEEQALSELSRLLASPMPRTDRLMWLKDQFDKTAEWWRNTIGGEQMAKDTDDMAERYMHVCENCNKYLEHDPVTVFKGWLLCEKLGSPYETRRQAALHMLADVWQLDRLYETATVDKDTGIVHVGEHGSIDLYAIVSLVEKGIKDEGGKIYGNG